jgi:hypothetical protein
MSRFSVLANEARRRAALDECVNWGRANSMSSILSGPKEARSVRSELVLARGEVTGDADRIVEDVFVLFVIELGELRGQA